MSEPNRGRRRWTDPSSGEVKSDAQAAVYANRRRIRGDRGKRLLRRRGERVERSFAHEYETGAMRRTHLRGHPNILKRLLIHTAGFNLGLLLRHQFGVGKPRPLQDGLTAATAAFFALFDAVFALFDVVFGLLRALGNFVMPSDATSTPGTPIPATTIDLTRPDNSRWKKSHY